MAHEMGDTDLLEVLWTDIVAIEDKYHFSCPNNYRNRYCSFLHTRIVVLQKQVLMLTKLERGSLQS